jgi:predicted site-specific integrase-resolvase
MPSSAKFFTAPEVGSWFGVNAESLKNWERAGKLKIQVSRTPGGHRRYTTENVQEIATLLGVDLPKQVLE